MRDPGTQREEALPQSPATGRGQSGLLGEAEKPEFCQNLKALEHPAFVGTVPVDVTAREQHKSPLVVLGRTAIYCKDLGLLTEWIIRRKPGWQKMSLEQPWGLEDASAQKVHLGSPQGGLPF